MAIVLWLSSNGESSYFLPSLYMQNLERYIVYSTSNTNSVRSILSDSSLGPSLSNTELVDGTLSLAIVEFKCDFITAAQ